MISVVTGGCGFVGRVLAKNILANGHEQDEVVIFDSLERHGKIDVVDELLNHPQVTFYSIDLMQSKELSEIQIPVDRFYHLAAVVGVGKVTKEPARVMRNNTLITLNVFDWFLKNKTPEARLLFASSSEVYAGLDKQKALFSVPTSEKVLPLLDDLENPRTSYGLSKLWGEAYARFLSQETNAFFASIRYHNVYGPHMGFQHVIPQITKRVKKRETPFRIIGGDQTRSFCWVEDAAEATRLLMESKKNKPGEVIHVGDMSSEVFIKDVYNKIFDICEWHPEDTIKEASPQGSVSKRCPDTTLLYDLTGFQPQMPFDEGLKKTVLSILEKELLAI